MASKFKPVRTNVSTRLNTVEVMVTGKKKLDGSGGAGARLQGSERHVGGDGQECGKDLGCLAEKGKSGLGQRLHSVCG